MPVVLTLGVGAATFASAWQSRAFVHYPEAELRGVPDVHAHKGRPVCQACHPGRDRRLRAEPLALCQGCHRAAHGSHPVGVPLKTLAPVELPLGEGRVVVCHSCHDPHDMKAFPHGLRQPMTPLCQRCHQGY
jgi:predicted CXXCH cytochrome family protein